MNNYVYGLRFTVYGCCAQGFRTKTKKTPFEYLKLCLSFYVSSVIALSLKTSFYAIAIPHVTTTEVVQVLKRKNMRLFEPKNNLAYQLE